MEKELVVFKDPKSPISEIFRTLRTNIQFMNIKGNAKTILVTSTFSGEGKSWISSNLAVSFAQAGKKTLLIDADMRKGRQYTIFEISPKPGLSNYLAKVSSSDVEESKKDVLDYVQKTKVDNLFVMSAGNIPPNPSELLISQRMLETMEEVKNIFDIIIIDSTPSQLVTDSLILTRITDTTIIVTASEETKREDLKRVINNIKNVGGHIAGVVLNKVQISAKKYEEKYYYSSKAKDVRKKEKVNMENFIRKNKDEYFEKKENGVEEKVEEKVEETNTQNNERNPEQDLTYINEMIEKK